MSTGRDIFANTASTINLGGGAVLVATTGYVSKNNATVPGTGFLSGTLTANILAGGVTINNNGYALLDAAALLSGGGGGGLTSTGSGSLILGAANTYTGNTLVSGGTLVLGSVSALQDSTLDTSGSGVLALGVAGAYTFGGLQGPNNLTLSTTASVPVALSVGGDGQSTSFSGNLVGGTTLTKVGAGILTLAGVNSYSGSTSVSSGVLVAGTTASVPGLATAGTIVVSSGAAFGGQIGSPGWTEAQVAAMLSTVTFNTGSAVALDSSNGNYTYSTALPWTTQGLVKTGANVLTLSGSNAYTGTTTVSNGTLAIGPAATLNNSGAAVTVNGATAALNVYGTYINSGTGTVQLVGGGALNFSGTGSIQGTTSELLVGNFTRRHVQHVGRLAPDQQ